MGIANQLGKFFSRIAELSQSLWELMSTKKAWVWGATQELAFQQLKEELTKATVLTLYEPCGCLIIWSIGAVFL